MCVQGDFLGLLLDFDINVDFTLVGPVAAELEIKEGDGIVGRLDTVEKNVLVVGTQQDIDGAKNIHAGKNVSVGHDFQQGAGGRA